MKLSNTAMIFILAFSIVTACSSQKHVTDAGNVVRDGSSVENAIIVKSIREEYEWIKINYPGSKVQQQALIGKGSKHFDVITFVTQAGETKQAYFDINSFFGKY